MTSAELAEITRMLEADGDDWDGGDGNGGHVNGTVVAKPNSTSKADELNKDSSERFNQTQTIFHDRKPKASSSSSCSAFRFKQPSNNFGSGDSISMSALRTELERLKSENQRLSEKKYEKDVSCTLDICILA